MTRGPMEAGTEAGLSSPPAFIVAAGSVTVRPFAESTTVVASDGIEQVVDGNTSTARADGSV